MTPTSKTEALELKISLFLRYGVIVAGLLMLVGWFIHTDFSTNPFTQFSTYQPLPLTDILQQSYVEKNLTVLLSYAGLFCLISLPIIRVLLTTVLFLKERQWTMAALACFVFVTLILSFALGLHIG